jgi:hypothetical protein
MSPYTSKSGQELTEGSIPWPNVCLRELAAMLLASWPLLVLCIALIPQVIACVVHAQDPGLPVACGSR